MLKIDLDTHRFLDLFWMQTLFLKNWSCYTLTLVCWVRGSDLWAKTNVKSKPKGVSFKKSVRTGLVDGWYVSGPFLYELVLCFWFYTKLISPFASVWKSSFSCFFEHLGSRFTFSGCFFWIISVCVDTFWNLLLVSRNYCWACYFAQ